MIANAITLSRLLLTFGVVILLGGHPSLDIALIATIALIFVLDAIDGLVARKRDETSELGAVLDTVADRIVENTFWIYFTAIGLIPLWMPLTVMARGFITDCLQRYSTSQKRRWAHALSHSRISRGLYGTLKMLTFMNLASSTVFKITEQVRLGLAIVTIAFCLLRAFPIVVRATETLHYESRRQYKKKHEKYFDNTRRTS